ncbi:MAG TPA: hypothetical protein VHO70_09185 [Chitinispirillaceae bacterium]|nr:hypothetical protein [Chitinispirillaceae bacterium]
MLRNISLIIFLMFLLTMAGGNRSSEKPGSDVKGKGSFAASSEIVGTLVSVNLLDSMFVIKTDDSKDTIYYNSKTKFSTENAEQVLRLNTKLRVYYKTKDDKKIATLIEPETADGKALSDTNGKDTSGKNSSPPEDTAGTSPPFPDGQTPP